MSHVRVLQRVILPGDGDLDVVPLYVETDSERGAQTAGNQSGRSDTRDVAVVGSPHSGVRFVEVGTGERPSRAAVVDGDRRVSFATYFNAFPAGYWRRWTVVEQVTLRLRVSGAATVVVYRSTAKGTSHPVRSLPVGSPAPPDGAAQEVSVELPLRQFVDGGWYWFDIVAGREGATLLSAQWDTRIDCPVRPGRVSIGITTFNRPAFLLDLLRQLGGAPNVLDLLDRVYVIDQGSDRVAGAARPQRRHQGGSATGSRSSSSPTSAGPAGSPAPCTRRSTPLPATTSCCSTTTWCSNPRASCGPSPSPTSPAVRASSAATCSASTTARCCTPSARRSPRTRGGGARPRTPGPRTTSAARACATRRGCTAGSTPTTTAGGCASSPPRSSAISGWPCRCSSSGTTPSTGCAPGDAGVPTVSMPGVAVWHVPWQDKTDAVDWQAYYHVRNRLVTALLHSPYDHGGRVVAESMETQIQHLLSMQYSTAAMRILALEDLLSGPAHLHADLATKNAQLAVLRADYPDARGEGDIEAFPPVRRRKPPSRGREATSPTNKLGLVRKVAQGGLRQLLPVADGSGRRPLVALPHQDAAWWLLSNVDSALVSAADGASVAWYQRDPAGIPLPARAQYRAAPATAARLASGSARPTGPRRTISPRRSSGNAPSAIPPPIGTAEPDARHPAAGNR